MRKIYSKWYQQGKCSGSISNVKEGSGAERSRMEAENVAMGVNYTDSTRNTLNLS